ncbi:hypothetical protein MKK84_25850 [Methylobacterium sp. E-065]|uniref:hypothetical protein n=1 Tax=Methylobacterium sp. E-065 TaxID=2836583 RepID=UPI001FBAE35A|nr:hypothetical protein [Methylobacterium sp. E-065]MCJ2020806.1 hypothetical protein [Methylobacterium sp. E-065]
MAVFLQMFLMILPNKRNVIRLNTRYASSFVCKTIQLFEELVLFSSALTIQARVRFASAAEPSQAWANAAGRAEAVEGADAMIVKVKLQTNNLEMFYF